MGPEDAEAWIGGGPVGKGGCVLKFCSAVVGLFERTPVFMTAANKLLMFDCPVTSTELVGKMSAEKTHDCGTPEPWDVCDFSKWVNG